jgi:hypothetical protein
MFGPPFMPHQLRKAEVFSVTERNGVATLVPMIISSSSSSSSSAESSSTSSVLQVAGFSTFSDMPSSASPVDSMAISSCTLGLSASVSAFSESVFEC